MVGHRAFTDQCIPMTIDWSDKLDPAYVHGLAVVNILVLYLSLTAVYEYYYHPLKKPQPTNHC